MAGAEGRTKAHGPESTGLPSGLSCEGFYTTSPDHGGRHDHLGAGIKPDREQQVLAAWKARNG